MISNMIYIIKLIRSQDVQIQVLLRVHGMRKRKNINCVISKLKLFFYSSREYFFYSSNVYKLNKEEKKNNCQKIDKRKKHIKK
jgi:hypothetical protein